MPKKENVSTSVNDFIKLHITKRISNYSSAVVLSAIGLLLGKYSVLLSSLQRNISVAFYSPHWTQAEEMTSTQTSV